MVYLFFILMSFSAFALVNVPDEPEINGIARFAQGLNSLVAGSGLMACDVSEANVNVPGSGRVQIAEGDRPMIRALLNQCLRNRSVRDNHWTNVNGHTPVLCTAPNGFKRMKRYYQVGRQNGMIRVRVPIRFTWVPGVSQGNRESAFRKLTAASRCAQNFYLRFGLHVSIDNVTDATAPVTIVSETLGRSSTAHVYMGENENHNACTMMAHEMGHFMGLPDRYVDAVCPARTGLMPSSDLMNNGGVYPPEMMTLNLLDFHRIIEPLCH